MRLACLLGACAAGGEAGAARAREGRDSPAANAPREGELKQQSALARARRERPFAMSPRHQRVRADARIATVCACVLDVCFVSVCACAVRARACVLWVWDPNIFFLSVFFFSFFFSFFFCFFSAFVFVACVCHRFLPCLSPCFNTSFPLPRFIPHAALPRPSPRRTAKQRPRRPSTFVR